MDGSGSIFIGVGGWSYAPWRGTFYPEGLPQKAELAHAADVLTAIEVNATFYRAPKPATYAKWRTAVPDGFVFTLKAPRYATNRKVLAEAGESVARFVTGGLGELGDALGPILWQLAPTKRFDPDDFAAFLALLPEKVDGAPLRHAVELRHDSFRTGEAVEIARRHGAAIVWAIDAPHPEIADPTADFAYLRLMGTTEAAGGYSARALDRHAGTLRRLAAGETAGHLLTGPDPVRPRDVFAFVIGGHKIANPAAAAGLIARVSP